MEREKEGEREREKEREKERGKERKRKNGPTEAHGPPSRMWRRTYLVGSVLGVGEVARGHGVARGEHLAHVGVHEVCIVDVNHRQDRDHRATHQDPATREHRQRTVPMTQHTAPMTRHTAAIQTESSLWLHPLATTFKKDGGGRTGEGRGGGGRGHGTN